MSLRFFVHIVGSVVNIVTITTAAIANNNNNCHYLRTYRVQVLYAFFIECNNHMM